MSPAGPTAIRQSSFFEAPDFWPTSLQEVDACLDGLSRGEAFDIGVSQGGRPIRAVAYGEREPIDRRSTYSSAAAAGHPEDFYDPDQRQRPVLLIHAAIHGAEIEGTVSCLNLAQILETGADLRGKAWPALQEAASKLRVVLVPVAQPDGRVRSAVRNLIGGTVDDLYYYGQGVRRSGELLTWPDCKRQQPIRVDDMEFLGGYYNDAGVNVQHDDFLSPNIAPETRALLDLVGDETPDCFLGLHSCGSGPFLIAPENLIPTACQFHQSRLGALIADRHRRDGLRPGGNTNTQPRGGFYLHTALHYACGALPLIFEFPHGLQMKPFTFDEILDIGLSLFEEAITYGVNCRYWPRY